MKTTKKMIKAGTSNAAATEDQPYARRRQRHILHLLGSPQHFQHGPRHHGPL